MNVLKDDPMEDENFFGAGNEARKPDTFDQSFVELLGVCIRVNFKAGDLGTKTHRLNLLLLGCRIWLESHFQQSMFWTWTRQPSNEGPPASRVPLQWAGLSSRQNKLSAPFFAQRKTNSEASH